MKILKILMAVLCLIAVNQVSNAQALCGPAPDPGTCTALDLSAVTCTATAPAFSTTVGGATVDAGTCYLITLPPGSTIRLTVTGGSTDGDSQFDVYDAASGTYYTSNDDDSGGGFGSQVYINEESTIGGQVILDVHTFNCAADGQMFTVDVDCNMNVAATSTCASPDADVLPVSPTAGDVTVSCAATDPAIITTVDPGADEFVSHMACWDFVLGAADVPTQISGAALLGTTEIDDGVDDCGFDFADMQMYDASCSLITPGDDDDELVGDVFPVFGPITTPGTFTMCYSFTLESNNTGNCNGATEICPFLYGIASNCLAEPVFSEADGLNPDCSFNGIYFVGIDGDPTTVPDLSTNPVSNVEPVTVSSPAAVLIADFYPAGTSCADALSGAASPIDANMNGSLDELTNPNCEPIVVTITAVTAISDPGGDCDGLCAVEDMDVLVFGDGTFSWAGAVDVFATLGSCAADGTYTPATFDGAVINADGMTDCPNATLVDNGTMIMGGASPDPGCGNAVSDDVLVVDLTLEITLPAPFTTAGCVQGIDLTGNIPLDNPASCACVPVELLYVNAEATANINRLTWATASELDNSHFEIERSLDGTKFEILGKVNGAGTTVEFQTYEYIDASPLTVSYYRLKQVDFAGTFEYSDIVLVDRKAGGKGIVEIFPIPTDNDVTVQYEVAANTDVTFTLTDVLGRIVSTQIVEANAGLNAHAIDMTNQATGLYFVTFSDGQTEQTRRIVKN